MELIIEEYGGALLAMIIAFPFISMFVEILNLVSSF